MAMTGSLNVRGRVLPVGGVTAKLEAAAQAGIRRAIIPKDNAQDVMIERKYYDTMEIILVETLRDVLEYAFVDCPRKQEYLEKLLPLNESGQSTAERLEPPKALPPRIPEGPIEEVAVVTETETQGNEGIPDETPVTIDGGANPSPL